MTYSKLAKEMLEPFGGTKKHNLNSILNTAPSLRVRSQIGISEWYSNMASQNDALGMAP